MRGFPRSARGYLLASAVLAVVSGLLLHSYLTRAARAEAASGPQVGVVVASQPIARGAVVAATALSVRRMPRAYAPPGSFSHIDQVAGRVALADLSPGEAVTETRLARVRAGPVASLVPEGLRAFAVPTSLPSGALAAGDRPCHLRLEPAPHGDGRGRRGGDLHPRALLGRERERRSGRVWARRCGRGRWDHADRPGVAGSAGGAGVRQGVRRP